MPFRFFFVNTGLNRFHSVDVNDMREAILGDEDDGPEAGASHLNRQIPGRSGRQARA